VINTCKGLTCVLLALNSVILLGPAHNQILQQLHIDLSFTAVPDHDLLTSVSAHGGLHDTCSYA